MDNPSKSEWEVCASGIAGVLAQFLGILRAAIAIGTTASNCVTTASPTVAAIIALLVR